MRRCQVMPQAARTRTVADTHQVLRTLLTLSFTAAYLFHTSPNPWLGGSFRLHLTTISTITTLPFNWCSGHRTRDLYTVCHVAKKAEQWAARRLLGLHESDFQTSVVSWLVYVTTPCLIKVGHRTLRNIFAQGWLIATATESEIISEHKYVISVLIFNVPKCCHLAN